MPYDYKKKEASSSYQKNVKPSPSDKFFNCPEPLYKIILQEEFKFKLPNLELKYYGRDPFDQITKY